MSSLLASPSALPFTLQGKNRPLPRLLTKAPTLCFVLLEVHGCHPTCRKGTQALTGANTGVYGFGLFFGQGVEDMAERRLAENLRPGVDSPKLLR